MKITKNDAYFFSSLFLAIWFAWLGMVWVYLINIIIAYPAGLLSFALWQIGKKKAPHPKRYQVIPIILGLGLLLSISTFIYLLIWD